MCQIIFFNVYIVAIGGLICLQGLYLIFLKWLRPDIIRSKDTFFGLVNLFCGLIFLFFNFRIDITTQLAVILESFVIFWYTYQSISLRRKLIRSRK